MNLNVIAESDLSFTLEDSINGFGVTLIFIDGELNRYQLNTQTLDIGFFIDPQTGVAVAGRQIEITMRISTLNTLGGGYPGKSWSVEYIDTNGQTWNLKVIENRPDRKLGVYNMLLESLKK